MNSENALIPAAQYLRTSRPFQDTYLEAQRSVIAQFAKINGYRIVKTYSDPARSGLAIKQRPAMQRLLNDVLQRKVSYRWILVYDVSRWGRFQDADEAAHYEFLCKTSGVPVLYCSEPYLNNSTATGAIFKSMRRSQAGEFSRELSEKVYSADKHIAALGFRLGGAAGFGLRRMMVSESRRPLQQLARSEVKYCKTNRTILVHGPKQEVAVVREMFAAAATGNLNCRQIADDLNARGIRFHTGLPWDYYDVYRTLTNPKYIGHNVWGRTSGKLRSSRHKTSPEKWTVKERAFAPIVDSTLFNRVQLILQRRNRPSWTPEELLNSLKQLLARKGKLSQEIIDKSRGMPSSATYYKHFGPLRRLYALLGYKAEKGTFAKVFRKEQNEKLRAVLFEQINILFPCEITVFHLQNRRRMILRLDDGVSVSVVLCRSLGLPTGERGWKLYPTHAESGYITLLCRLTEGNDGFLDFHLFPFINKRSWYSFSQDDLWFRRGKRLDSLKDLCREAKLLSRLGSQLTGNMPARECFPNPSEIAT